MVATLKEVREVFSNIDNSELLDLAEFTYKDGSFENVISFIVLNVLCFNYREDLFILFMKYFGKNGPLEINFSFKLSDKLISYYHMSNKGSMIGRVRSISFSSSKPVIKLLVPQSHLEEARQEAVTLIKNDTFDRFRKGEKLPIDPAESKAKIARQCVKEFMEHGIEDCEEIYARISSVKTSNFASKNMTTVTTAYGW